MSEHALSVSFRARSTLLSHQCGYTLILCSHFHAALILTSLVETNFRTRGMKACSAILKSIDLLILRPEDKAPEGQCCLLKLEIRVQVPDREP